MGYFKHILINCIHISGRNILIKKVLIYLDMYMFQTLTMN